MSNYYIYSYNAIGDIICLLIAFFHLVVMKTRANTNPKLAKLFHLATLVIGLMCFTNLLYHYGARYISLENRYVIYIVRSLCKMLQTFSLFLFEIYVIKLLNIDDFVAKKVVTLEEIMMIIATFIGFFLPTYRSGFYINENLTIYQNSINIFSLVDFLFVSITIATLFFYRKNCIPRIFNEVSALLCFNGLIFIVEDYLRDSSFMSFAYTMPIILIYNLLHSSPYLIESGTLDRSSFLSHIENLTSKKQKFALICLQIDNSLNESNFIKELKTNYNYFYQSILGKSNAYTISSKRIIFLVNRQNLFSNEESLEIEEGFKEICKSLNLDYRLNIIYGDSNIQSGEDYILFNKLLDKRMELNSFSISNEKDIEYFLRSKKIVNQLRDISLKHDLFDERILVYCQPVFNTENEKYTTAEALMRLNLPELGIVYPDEFIPLAEEFEYIHILSKIILNKTCRELREIIDKGYDIKRISVNFSMLELKQDDFIEDIVKIIQNYEIPFEGIAIELTESKNEKDFNLIKDKIAKLKEYGIKFYLDDFGTGYSNLERIAQLPIDIIKFDKSLVYLSNSNERSKIIVNNFAKSFIDIGCEILFEGVEDLKDEELCKEMKASYLQGYKYSKPIPIEKYKDFL